MTFHIPHIPNPNPNFNPNPKPLNGTLSNIFQQVGKPCEMWWPNRLGIFDVGTDKCCVQPFNAKRAGGGDFLSPPVFKVVELREK